MTGLIGRKLGMTRVFDAEGAAVPGTGIEAGPPPLVQIAGDPSELGFGAREPERAARAALHRGGPAGREGGRGAESSVRAGRGAGADERPPHDPQAGRAEPP